MPYVITEPDSIKGVCETWDECRSKVDTHTLGVSKHPTAFPGTPKPPEPGRAVWVAKRPLTPAEVDELTRARERPDFLVHPTLTLDGNVYTVHVPTLAWGLHQMLRELFRHEAQAKRANKTARVLLGG